MSHPSHAKRVRNSLQPNVRLRPLGCRTALPAPGLCVPSWAVSSWTGSSVRQQLSSCGSPGPLLSLATNTLSSLKTPETLFGSRYAGFPLGLRSTPPRFPGALAGLEGQGQAQPDI